MTGDADTPDGAAAPDSAGRTWIIAYATDGLDIGEPIDITWAGDD